MHLGGSPDTRSLQNEVLLSALGVSPWQFFKSLLHTQASVRRARWQRSCPPCFVSFRLVTAWSGMIPFGHCAKWGDLQGAGPFPGTSPHACMFEKSESSCSPSGGGSDGESFSLTSASPFPQGLFVSSRWHNQMEVSRDTARFEAAVFS